MHAHAGSALDNRVTLTFDLLPLASMRAERLSCAVRLPDLLLIAQAVFLLERRPTPTDAQSQTPLITVPTHRLYTAGVDS